MTAVQNMLAKARSQLGYHEGKNNHTKYGDWYAAQVHDKYFAYAPWCDEFISWLGAQCGYGAVVGRFASTPAHARWFYNQGRWGHTPRVGAIVFFDWAGSHNISAIDHVGIVEAIRADGHIVTIEGNSANQVIRRVRDPRTCVAGYGYPKYPGSSSSKPAPAPKPGSLKVDGQFGPLTVRALQAVLKVSTTGSFNSTTKKALQKHLKVKADGVIGPVTIKALQKHVGSRTDGNWGPATTRALQTTLNAKKF